MAQWERVWVNIICIVLANNGTTVVLFCGEFRHKESRKRDLEEYKVTRKTVNSNRRNTDRCGLSKTDSLTLAAW